MSRQLDIGKIDIALRRAARRAAYAPPEERAGRFLVSSAIRSVEYDEQARELDVTFVSGRAYRYSDVPPDVYVDFLDAASKGQFFNEHIKDEFSCSEIDTGR